MTNPETEAEALAYKLKASMILAERFWLRFRPIIKSVALQVATKGMLRQT